MSLHREDVLREISSTKQWDVVIIGGGATGLGAAVEASSRGYKTLLLEAHDFAKGTSSRSTKLVHGGVRYLQQGNVKLVLEALRERGRLLRNAPHLVHRLAFIIPAYARWEIPFYGIGLSVYDLLAGGESMGRSRIVSRSAVLNALPTVRREGLKGGTLYYDGQFDDARLAITLLRTFDDLGGTALNYSPVTGLLKLGHNVRGVIASDLETGTTMEVSARVVINATGIFADRVRQMDEPNAGRMVMASQGTHLVLDRRFLPTNSAMMIPRTSDRRVLFAIPWHASVVVGTTDDPVPQPDLEPQAMGDERAFLMQHVERYLGHRPGTNEVLSVWSGQRPLVRQQGVANTAAISRDHTVLISRSQLITIIGGKWTTYRKMGEDVVNQAAQIAKLKPAVSRTASLRLHGATNGTESESKWEDVYGADLSLLNRVAASDPELDKPLHPLLPFRRAEVLWAARCEMARRLEDVLARRTRALFLNARASVEAAPVAAKLLAGELGRDIEWESQQIAEYEQLAEQYIWKQ